MSFLDLIKFLVSIGLSPLEVGTCVVAIVLYTKAEALDAALHKCLDETVKEKVDREIQERIDQLK